MARVPRGPSRPRRATFLALVILTTCAAAVADSNGARGTPQLAPTAWSPFYSAWPLSPALEDTFGDLFV